jgi:cation/acetate symporter
MSGDHQGLALVLFTSFVLVTLGITAWAGRRRSSSVEFFAGGRLFSPTFRRAPSLVFLA